jgi:hypothetical protein
VSSDSLVLVFAPGSSLYSVVDLPIGILGDFDEHLVPDISLAEGAIIQPCKAKFPNVIDEWAILVSYILSVITRHGLRCFPGFHPVLNVVDADLPLMFDPICVPCISCLDVKILAPQLHILEGLETAER